MFKYKVKTPEEKEREKKNLLYKGKSVQVKRREKPRAPGWSYCERKHEMWLSKPDNHICLDCKYTLKRNAVKCPACGSERIEWAGPVARVPKKNASKKRWKDYWEKGFKAHPTGCR